MIKLGVTGNIACGKSLIGEYLNKQGFNTLDSDQTVHAILSVHNEITDKIINLCNPHEITSFQYSNKNKIRNLQENNSKNDECSSYIDRRKLGLLLFQDKNLKKQIELIIHPLVSVKTEKFFQEEELKGNKLAANLIPLLFESKSQNRFDCIWLIYCNVDEQKTRLKIRNPQLSDQEIDLRIKSQMSQEEKKKLVDFVIDNSGTIERTFEQVDLVLKTNLKVLP